MCRAVALVALAATLVGLVTTVDGDGAVDRHLAQQHGGSTEQPVPFAYCKPFLERLSPNDQHQLRESYQQYHGAYARFMRAARNHEAFQKGPATWIEDPGLRQGWNVTYLVGNNLENLTRTKDDAETVMKNMESRIKAQLTQLEGQNSLPAGTQVDQLSPCIMRKIYPSQFPDQPVVSLLLRLRGEVAPGDWPPPSTNSTKEPPTGFRGTDAVSAFIKRAQACSKVAATELLVMLSGPGPMLQASTWAWQSWQTEGFVVPLLDTLDREAAGLNRLASVARGQLLVALRADRPGVDDLLPAAAGGEHDCAWLQRIVTLYHRVPQLGAMAHGRYSFSHPANDASLRLLAAGIGGGPAKNNMWWQEPMTSVPFQYVLYGDFSPMSFRRSALEEVGGFDEDLPQGDEPCSSVIRRDLSLRLWKSGWRVGAHEAGMLQQPAINPTAAQASDPTRCSADVAALASQLFEARHAPPGLPAPSPMDALMARVRQLNMGQGVKPIDAAALAAGCPMAQGCTP
ncbi:hypothetical protein HXX76_004223 [Chlamydomonas incerta]|uniref:Uncharacterized protein n=1 Tax=Chlamydomonas incerta TaxID=51695 RepID=A0A835T777_CHLIN|nr:hypothetical protein HXX76_004223 [Chlamydomonas incerta]|eukprot:KAG2440109.1 hypothetical protein HXX76_004223 [Chlamydomonas incerta]